MAARKREVVAVAPAVVEVEPKKPGLSFEDGIVLCTTLLLAVAIVLLKVHDSSYA
jgi:hypothetical protein